jgi:hypothetical protein
VIESISVVAAASVLIALVIAFLVGVVLRVLVRKTRAFST